ncbi:hypothetical protein VTI28DRAFT_8239 [Corynascus sepedonium]
MTAQPRDWRSRRGKVSFLRICVPERMAREGPDRSPSFISITFSVLPGLFYDLLLLFLASRLLGYRDSLPNPSKVSSHKDVPGKLLPFLSS